jgi:hypothetical protein
VVAIVDLFKEVNDIEDAQVRLHTWATPADGIMRLGHLAIEYHQ